MVDSSVEGALPDAGGSLVDKESGLDPMRKEMLSRMRARRLTLADLSRAVGANDAYFYQHFYRGYPKFLKEGPRAVIAALLEMDEADLVDPAKRDDWRARRNQAVHARPTPQLSADRAARDVPIYREGDEVDPTKATEWQPGFGRLNSPSFAVWVTTPRGRLMPGDLAYVVTTRPPRRGDSVVVVKDRRLQTVGELTAISATEAAIDTGAHSPESFSLPGCQLFRVAGVQYP